MDRDKHWERTEEAENAIMGRSDVSQDVVSAIQGSYDQGVTDEFIFPHGIYVDKDNNIWITDVALNQIFKFSPDWRLLLTLGERGMAGETPFHGPNAQAIFVRLPILRHQNDRRLQHGKDIDRSTQQ